MPKNRSWSCSIEEYPEVSTQPNIPGGLVTQIFLCERPVQLKCYLLSYVPIYHLEAALQQIRWSELVLLPAAKRKQLCLVSVQLFLLTCHIEKKLNWSWQ